MFLQQHLITMEILLEVVFLTANILMMTKPVPLPMKPEITTAIENVFLLI